MKRNSSLLASVLVICLVFFSCQKDENDCAPTDNFLFYMFAKQVSGILTTAPVDTTYFFANIYKSNSGSKMPTLQINNQGIQLSDNGRNRCSSGSEFLTDDLKLPNIHQTGYFLHGQTNTLTLVGDRCGTVSEDFRLPDETKLKPRASAIINRNQDLVLEFTGADDFPIDIPNNDDPTSQFDQIGLEIGYYRGLSDTVAYPGLPVQPVFIGKLISHGDTKVTISAAELQTLPLNGRVILQFYRDTQFKLPNREKGELFIQFDQLQQDYFDIKN